jgi:hypothetical protein
MLRISAFIAIVMVVGVGPSAAQAQTKSTQKCYNAQTCDTECMRSGTVRSCPKHCDHQRATLPACR